ncbi:unnamed protein product, partial [Allacma fusca]
SNMFAISTEDSDSSNDEDLNVEDETEEITFYCNSDSDEESDDDSGEIDIESSLAFTDQFHATLDGSIIHIRCTAHQLQLAMNKSLEDSDASDYLAYINSVIKYFTNNTVYLAKLRKLAGKGLLKKAETRWNYWVDALRRLAEDIVFDSARHLLEHAHKMANKGERRFIPRNLTKLDLKKIKEMVALLQPFADLTDTLQGDGVTSSILIPSIVSKLKLLNSVEEKYFANLKIEIATQIKIRFATIVTNPIYVLASALDPRIKLNTFKLKETGGLSLPTYVEAKRICDTFLKTEDIGTAEAHSQRKETQDCPNFLDVINNEA